MARYSDIDNSIWEDLQECSKNAKLLYIYAFSNSACRESGLYKISLPTILLHTKLKEVEFDKACIELNSKIAYDKDKKIMFISGKLKRRLSGLKTNINLIKSIEYDFAICGDSFVTRLFLNKYEGALEGLIEPLARGSIPLPLPLHIDKGVVKGEKKLEKDKYLDFVLLTKKEHTTINNLFGIGQTKALIERLNNYIGSKGKKYKSHYFTILNWAGKDGIRKQQITKVSDPTKDFKEPSDEDRKKISALVQETKEKIGGGK